MFVTPKLREETRSEIYACCKSLYLSKNVLRLCEDEATPKQEEFLLRVLSEELGIREKNRQVRLLNRANFPTLKSFAEYEFQSIRFPPTMTKEELMTIQFIKDKQNLILYGPVGTGKTHMAVALGILACEMGLQVKFYSVTSLVLKLGEAWKAGTMERLVRELQSLDLLVLDEWGYVPIDKEGSQLLFRIVSDSYERKSLILTTNLEFSKWGSIFTDEQMAAAMIDRLIHHGHLILFDDKDSYRMSHALMRQVMRRTAEPN